MADIRVIVTDDSALARALLREFLESAPGITVIAEARNGQEAVDLTVKLRPDLVTMDLEMPVMNGLEFLAKVKQDPDLMKLPVVILSTFKEEADRASAFKHGAAGYMVKPIDAAKYLFIMKTIADYWQSSELPA